MSSKSNKVVKPHQLTLLKFKRNKATYLLPIDLHLKSQLKLNKFVSQLVLAINNSGGLLIDEPETKDRIDDEDDILIPKSEYIDENDEDNIPIPKSEYIDKNEDMPQEDVTGLKMVTEEDISLAIPQDKTSPYSNKWIELTDSTLAEIAFRDFDILSFKYVTDDNFNIIEAVYND